MKTVKYFLIIFFSVSFFFACDKVEGPFREELVVPEEDTTEAEVKIRKVLLEDYTGAKCGNCPEAAVEANRLKALYGEKLVVLAVHAGFFAKPGASPFTYDFRTTVGNRIDTVFGISNAGNPNGMINRRYYPNKNHIISHPVWGDSLINIIDKEPDAHIKITNSYNSSSSLLTTTITSEFLKAMEGDYSLGVYIAEDSIVKPQKFYTPTDHNVLDYVHKHVLRGAVNGTWGEALTSGTAAAGSSYSKTYTYTLNTEWNASKCSVVAFIYNSATYEVVQVQETKIIK